MPYSFGNMTGALLNDYYAQPGIYLAQTPYGSYAVSYTHLTLPTKRIV